MEGYIYYIKNIVTNKYYIGQTRNFKQRINDHFKRTHKECSKLYNAIWKYGRINFLCVIIEYFHDVNDDILNEREKYYIQFYDTIKNGYNIRVGGKCVSGWNHSNKTKEKISKSKKGQLLGVKRPEQGLKHRGGGNPRAKKVMCLNNNMIFDCAKDAATWCNGDNSVIIKCCKGKLQTHRNLRWEYYKIEKYAV